PRKQAERSLDSPPEGRPACDAARHADDSHQGRVRDQLGRILSVMKVFDIEPRVNGKVTLGSGRKDSVILAGRMAEKPNSEPLYFDGSDNFVVFEVGKRGSGKSYGMGSMLEAFATADGSKISNHRDRRAVILLDPLDIHWTACLPLSADGPDGLRRQ